MSLPLYAFKTGNHDKVEIISAPSLSMSENRGEDQKQFIVSSYLSIIYFCFKIDRSMNSISDRSKFPFCALIQLVLISRSSWFEERIGKFSVNLQQTLEEYGQEVIITKFNKATFLVYHNTTCLKISDLIRNRLGFDNRVVPFSKYILLDTDESLSLLQQQMKFHKIQFRSCTRMINNTLVEFECERQSADGYLKFRQMGLQIKGFCNEKGVLIQQITFNISKQISSEVDTPLINQQQFPICSLIILINKIPSQFKKQFKNFLEKSYCDLSQRVAIQRYNQEIFVVHHDLTCYIISRIIQKMGIENRVIPFSNYMLLEANNIQTKEKMQNKMKQMNIKFRGCSFRDRSRESEFCIFFDSNTRCIYGYLRLRQEGYKIQFCNQKWQIIYEMQF